MSKDMKKAVCIINLQVMNVNGFVTATINGHSTPNTFIGFKTALTMNLEKKLDNNDVLFKHDSLKKNVIQIFHKVEQVNSDMHKTDASNYKKQGGLVPKTIMDNKVLNEDLSLIFELYIDPEKKEEIELLVNKEVQKMRFGGGFIKNSKTKFIVDGDLDKDGKQIDIMKEIAKSVKKGFVMKECFDEVKDINGLIESLKVKKLKFKKENEKSVWKTATILGYALLNEAENTDFSRFGHKHAFAEPLIGLVEFEFFHQYIKEVTYENFFKVGWITLFEKVNENDNGLIRYITNEEKNKIEN